MSLDVRKRYDANPFIGQLDVPISTRQVRVSPMGGKDNNVLINQHTGEIRGTHVSTYKKVDSAEFVKIFTQNIALTFDLKSAGIKAFNVLMFMMQSKAIQKDLLVLDKFTLDDFIANYEDRKPPVKLSLSTFKRGLNELEEAQIIAKHMRPGWYFINPNFAFNGDRIAFTTIIEKNGTTKKEEQQELPLDAPDEINEN